MTTPTPPEIGLLPCPFCGSSDIDPEGVASFKKEYRTKDLTWDKDATPDKIEHRPACNNCSATTDGGWNTRPTAEAGMRGATDDAEAMRLWRECGLPEYFLGNGGTNHKLVDFVKRIQSDASRHDDPRGLPELDKYKAVFDAAFGLCCGYDWKNGTHAKTHGYRAKLLKAVNDIREVPDFDSKYQDAKTKQEPG